MAKFIITRVTYLYNSGKRETVKAHKPTFNIENARRMYKKARVDVKQVFLDYAELPAEQ